MRTPASRWMLIGFSAVVPRAAQAQADIALDRFEPAAPSSSLLAVMDPSVNVSKWTPATGALLSYADAPLVLVNNDSDRRERVELVNHQLVLHLQASMQLARRDEVGLNLPFVISQSGESPTQPGANFSPPPGGAVGDLRLTARIGMLNQRGLLPAAGILVSSWFPTGKDSAYAGAGQVRAGISLLLGAELGPFLWRASVGRQNQADDAVLPTGHSGWTSAIGGAYRWRDWQLGPELWGSTAADGRVLAFARRSTNLEALLALRYRWSDFSFTAAAGPGLAQGPGTPRFRVVLGIAFAPRHRPEPLAMGAGNVSPVSRADEPSAASPALVLGNAKTASTLEQATVEPDSDRDGILDRQDACPMEFGIAHADQTRHGCPLDSDGDGIADIQDACQKAFGVAHNESSLHGCPADRDRDGITDDEDACPDAKGDRSSDPKRNGCKSAVTIQGTQLVLTQQIHFKIGSDEILGDSGEVLQQLAQILDESPSIARVAVDGHTDNVGAEATNLSLSRRRAIAVVRWLVQHGIDERRLEARGFGPRQPLVPNHTEEGRAKNRRVEFTILKRTELGTQGWKDGPVHD